MTQLHVYPTDHDSFRAALDTACGGDTILMHEGIYDLAIDSYDGRLQGGTSWSTKLTIKPYGRDRARCARRGGREVSQRKLRRSTTPEARAWWRAIDRLAASAPKLTTKLTRKRRAAK